MICSVYFIRNKSQGDGQHTKIGMSGCVGDRIKTIETSFSIDACMLDFIIECETKDEMEEIETYLHDNFEEYSTKRDSNYTSSSTEWFDKVFAIDDIQKALENGGYGNNVISDKDELEKILSEHKRYDKEQKEKQRDKCRKIIKKKEKERDKKIKRDKQSIKDEIKWFEREYQTNIIELGLDKLNELGKFYLELATGAGKTYIVFNIFKKIKPDTIVIFTPRKNINKQNISDKYLSILDDSYNVFDNNSSRSFKKFYKQGKNIIVACIQSYETVYGYLTENNIQNVFTWFDEAHWMVENWTNIKNDENIIIQYFLKSPSIKYRMFTSASPNHELIKRNESSFGQLYSPIKVKQLIKDKWLCPILSHIFETNSQNTNVIQYCLKHFTKYQKSWGFSFHSNCINAGALFKIHYDLYKNGSTKIKPFIDVSDSKELELSDIFLDYSFTDIGVFEITKNSMAYVVQKYSMGYDSEKIDYLAFCDPKSSYKDIIQCVGRGTRSDKQGENGTNLEKKLHIMLPIYMDQMEIDKSPYETISEVLRYLIYDIELDPLEDIEFVEAKKLGRAVVGTDYRGGDDTRAILLDLLKGGKYSSIKKPDLIQMLKDKDVHDNSSYYRLKENRPDLELPELFSAFPDFTFEETYDNSPYYSKQECIENIKNIMESNDIDGDDEDIDYYHEIDSKIPDQALFHFYGGCRNDYPCY